MKCSLPANVNECPFFMPDNHTCNNEKKCSFQENEIVEHNYKKEERWYEKYYKNH